MILLLNREKGIKNLRRFIAHVHGVSESIDGVGGGCFASGLIAGLNCGLRVTSGDVRNDFCCGSTVAAETVLICCNRRWTIGLKLNALGGESSLTGVTKNRVGPEFCRIVVTRFDGTASDSRCELERFDFIDDDGVSSDVETVLESRLADDCAANDMRRESIDLGPMRFFTWIFSIARIKSAIVVCSSTCSEDMDDSFDGTLKRLPGIASSWITELFRSNAGDCVFVNDNRAESICSADDSECIADVVFLRRKTPLNTEKMDLRRIVGAAESWQSFDLLLSLLINTLQWSLFAVGSDFSSFFTRAFM